MNRSMLIIIGGALVVAMIVAVIVQMSLGGSKKKADVASSEILVANKTMLTGEIIKAENTHWEFFPDKTIFKGTIKRKGQPDEKKLEVFGKPLRRTIESGEPVTTQAVVTNAKGTGTYLSAAISPGMRAMAISVKAETLAGGFVSQGDYVDIIMTYQVGLKGKPAKYSLPEVQKYASETILSNIRVLALDQNAKEAGHEPKVARTVTVEVSKQDAQTLAMAHRMGSLTLSLRRLGEKDTEADRSVQPTTDVKTVGVIKNIYKIMDKSETGAGTVRIYNGASVVNLPVRVGDGVVE